ncbi:hypothetical protein V6N13_053705 [Hibiscus sabdariffa]
MLLNPPLHTPVCSMVTVAGTWEWSRLTLLLADHILHKIDVIPPPNVTLGRDLLATATCEDKCSICDREAESIDHVLRHCSMARRVWQEVIIPDKLYDWYNLPFMEWLACNICGIGGYNSTRENWVTRFSVLCQLLWNNRCNSVLFPNFLHKSDYFMSLIVFRLNMWRLSLQEVVA